MSVVAGEPAVHLHTLSAGARGFAGDGVLASWYCIGRARRYGRARATPAWIGATKLAVWRDERGRIAAMPARCPHLGADLTQGTVDRGTLVCPMHGWTFGSGARGCLSVVEAHGLVFVLTGGQGEMDESWVREPGEALHSRRAWLLPPQKVRANGHLVLGNGFDTAHYGPLHGVDLLGAERVEIGDRFVYAVDIEAKLHGKRRWRALGMEGVQVGARFLSVGAGLTWVICRKPMRFAVLFSATPLDAAQGGGCRTQAAFFAPSGSLVTKLRALALMYGLVCDDRRVLEGMRFQRNWTRGDACLRGYAEMVDRLPACGEGDACA